MNTTEYLQEHGLDPEFVKKALGWAWDDNKITIPIYDIDGKLLYCKYRNMTGEKKFEFDPGNSPALYGIHRIQSKKQIILCEGEADAAILLQNDFPAVTTGSVSNHKQEILSPLAGREVIIILDNDKPGQKAISEFYTSLIAAGSTPKIATLPKEVKDVCEYFVTGSKAGMKQILDQAITLDDWQEANKPPEFTVLTGETLIERNFPAQRWLIKRIVPANGITFIVGSEGVGKSFNALTMADSIANKDKWLDNFEVEQSAKVLILDMENSLAETQDRMNALGINGKGLFFLEYPHLFSFDPENKDEDFSPFALYIKSFVEKNNIGLIIIDSFIDLMTGNENSSQETQVFFRSIKQLFGDKSIIILHHAGKSGGPIQRTSSEKTRGSTNIQAQAFSSLYVSKIPRSENEYSMEQTKLRGGGQKIKKFKIEMKIHEDIYNKEVTQVIGLKYRGEIIDEVEKSVLCEDLILQSFDIMEVASRMELEARCTAAEISKRTFATIIKKLQDDKILERIGVGKQASFRLV